MRWTRAWPHVRAGLLCLFIAGNLLQALPLPRKEIPEEDAATWRRGDTDLWFRWLRSASLVGPDREQFQERVVHAYGVLLDVGAVVQAPVRPFFSRLRSTQQWGLFAVVGEKPERLVVEIEVDGTWKRISARLDPEHTWNDERFRYRRVRGTWDTIKPDKPAPLYEAFARWTARAAFRAFPAAERVRVKRDKEVASAPWETLDPTVTPKDERAFTRDDDLLWVLK